MEYFGATITVAGTCASFNAKYWWIPLLFAAPGALIVARSVIRRRRLRKDIMTALEKEVNGLNYEELEKRVNDGKYELSRPDEERVKQNEMEAYSHIVIDHVMKKEHFTINRPYTLAGLGILIGGFYLSQKGSPNLGRLIALLGASVAAVSEFKGFMKMRKLKKDISSFIYEKGYDFLQIHAPNKNPYDFYKRHILPELEKPKQKD